MTEFTYKNQKIILAANGAFTCTVNGAVRTSPSLDGMKKQIDKLNTFEAFDAYITNSALWNSRGPKPIPIVDCGSGGALYQCRVIGFDKKKGDWLTNLGPVHNVLHFTDTAREAWTALAQARRNENEERDHLRNITITAERLVIPVDKGPYK